MLWHAMPPELNTAMLMAGAGPAPMLQAAAGWEALGASLEAQAAELAASLAALKAAWTGLGSERAVAAATPMVGWLQDAAKHAQQRGMQASAQAAAYMQALGTTPSLPEIASNHISHTVLSATNFFGINMVPIGMNETDYFVRMWTQAGTSMDVYQAETMANTTFEPPQPVKPILQPTMGEAVEAEAMSRISEMAAESAPGSMRRMLSALEDDPVPTPDVPVSPFDQLMQFLGGMGQLSGPMQQLMQPLQQLTSMMGQGGGLGSTSGLGDSLVSSTTPKVPEALGQMGLLGASPLSNHPLAGGLGPSMGMGLMQAEAVPGTGGSAARTSLMSQLIDKPAAGVAPAGAGAGSSAMGGSAPMGAMGAGAGAQSGAGSRPGLVAPGLLAAEHDESEHDGVDDQDDW
jgi:PPE-repeat protein